MDVTYDVYDIDRLYRMSDQSICPDDIDVDLRLGHAAHSPALKHWKGIKYKSYLLMLDGETLPHLFRRYGSRLYDTNLRSYLESKTKVNKGMFATIRTVPQKFLAYNNGLTAIASRIEDDHRQGQPCVTRVVGLQIVNGAQTTSSIYKASTDKRTPRPKLSNVHVVMKLTRTEPEDMETFVSEITEFANTQNPIKGSDPRPTSSSTVGWRSSRVRRCAPAPSRDSGSTSGPEAPTRRRSRARGRRRRSGSNSLNGFLLRTGSTRPTSPSSTWHGRDGRIRSAAGRRRTSLSSPRGLRPVADRGPDRSQVLQADRRQGDRLRSARKAVAKCGILKIPSSVTAYLVAYFAHKFGDVVRLGAVWENQAVSEGLRMLFERWAPEINSAIINSNSQDRLLPEWCKKEGCWTAVKALRLRLDGLDIPEIALDAASREASRPIQLPPSLQIEASASAATDPVA